MNKICTSIEQSKKLIELGIDVNTADMTYRPIMDIDSMSNVGFLNIPECYPFNEFKDCNIKPLPAWSLSSLLDMLDYEVVDAEGESCYLKIDKDDIEYQIRYEDRWNSGIETKWYDNSLDAAFEMVCRLKENNLL